MKDQNIIYVDTQVLGGTLINANSDYSTLIYLIYFPFINQPWNFISPCLNSHVKMKINCVKTCRFETKLN